MLCPKCGSELRISNNNPEYGLCDVCMKKYLLDKNLTFEFKSGTTVLIKKSIVEILRNDAKSAMKTLVAGRTMGYMAIKKSAITGVVFNADYLIICASGLPSPNDFKISSISEIKQYPNCIVAKESELKQLYSALIDIIQ